MGVPDSMLKTLRASKRTQVLLIVLAALVSLLPLAAQKRQGNSIRWSVDGDTVSCEYYQLPSFSHVRTYNRTKINGVMISPDSQDESIEVVRFQLNGLNLNIPSQSSNLIWNFGDYVAGLQLFMAHAKGADPNASYSWRHPWMVAGVSALTLAVALWVLVFSVLLLGPVKNEP